MSKEENVRERETLLNWASNLNMDHVILTGNKSGVESIGGKGWSELTVVVRTAFISANRLKILHTFRLGRDLGKIITHHISAESHRNLVAPKKKKSASTKPKCITWSCTLYRVINTISKCKESFTGIKSTHDKDDQDTSKEGKSLNMAKNDKSLQLREGHLKSSITNGPRSNGWSFNSIQHLPSIR